MINNSGSLFPSARVVSTAVVPIECFSPDEILELPPSTAQKTDCLSLFFVGLWRENVAFAEALQQFEQRADWINSRWLSLIQVIM
ncbi:hypothetical protein H257_11095 [Aphanomyces astaci]|uniref:Uncharacterized protein n=1 Tax=Aphanomyces astaci TaxID=112090 RepID=W4G378_APHAT|nr:hypothetical protein H257_11095 [Aphanomyces astaci]ETV74130.1 hypothetical protein H257_11095 [Aphanomyces astaci]|eukprot:XP_009836236.1 hypothetical protein H257_11095 [Aphanomyces astaci]